MVNILYKKVIEQTRSLLAKSFYSIFETPIIVNYWRPFMLLVNARLAIISIDVWYTCACLTIQLFWPFVFLVLLRSTADRLRPFKSKTLKQNTSEHHRTQSISHLHLHIVFRFRSRKSLIRYGSSFTIFSNRWG